MVSISAAESLKMLAFSVVWGSWVVVRNAAARTVGPLWSNCGGGGNGSGSGGRGDGRGDGDDRETGAADDDAAATATGAVATYSGGKSVRRAALRDRPPPCLSTTVYGTHSYVKVKVPFYCKYHNITYYNIMPNYLCIL